MCCNSSWWPRWWLSTWWFLWSPVYLKTSGPRAEEQLFFESGGPGSRQPLSEQHSHCGDLSSWCNDNSPKFGSSSYTIDVSEDAAVGLVVLDATATDVDEGENGQILYFLSQEAKGAFTVHPDTGKITTTALLDREKRASYIFQVYAVDLSPSAPRNTTAQVTITILDVNDNAPFFIQDPLIINVSSGSVSTHQVVATMRAEDKDFGANGSVFYRFAMPVRGFAINSLTGEIQTTEKLQTLTQTQRTLIVEAMDQGSPPQSSLGVVIVYVKEQDYKGIRFSRTARDVSIQENAAKGRQRIYSKNDCAISLQDFCYKN